MISNMASTKPLEIIGASSSALSFASHPASVGSCWMFSSVIFSTYYTTAFLTHGLSKEKDDFHERQMEMMAGAKEEPPLKGREVRISSSLKCLSRSQLLTLYRFSGSLLLGIFANPRVFECGQRLMDTIHHMRGFALPAIFLFAANYSNSIALERIGISLTYTSKCLIPLITVLMTLFVEGLNALPSTFALVMLIPIGSGVAMASWNSPTFEKRGFLAAIISSTAQAALNVSSKRALLATGISGLEAQRSMASVAFIISSCMSIYIIASKKDGVTDDSKLRPPLPSKKLAFLAAAAYHFEYVLSFLFLKMVQPIGYGTCDAIRRLGIIVAGRKFFGGQPFSKMNYGGIALAVLGAMGYSIGSAKN